MNNDMMDLLIGEDFTVLIRGLAGCIDCNKHNQCDYQKEQCKRFEGHYIEAARQFYNSIDGPEDLGEMKWDEASAKQYIESYFEFLAEVRKTSRLKL